MGQSSSKEKIKLIAVQKEYSNIECASSDTEGKNMYVALHSKDPDRVAISICKIDAGLNKTIDFYPNNSQQVRRILSAEGSDYLILQTDHKVVIYDKALKKSTIVFDFERSFVAMTKTAVYIQSAPTSIMEVNFETKETQTHKIDYLELCRIQSFCVSENEEDIYIVGVIVKSERSIVLKYSNVSGQVEQVHRSTKDIQKIEISDTAGYVIASKLSGTVTLYDTKQLCNKKNLRFAGSLINIKLIRGEQDRVLACYDINADVTFVFWNLSQLINERIVKVVVNLTHSDAEILFANSDCIGIQTSQRIVFFGLSQEKETLKERYNFDEQLLDKGAELIKFNAILPSLERNMRSEVYINSNKNLMLPPEVTHPVIKSSNQSPKASLMRLRQASLKFDPEIDREKANCNNSENSGDLNSQSTEDIKNELIRVSNINLETLNRICLSCKTNLSDITFYPCKHSVVCHRCVKSVGSQCLLCSQQIRKRSMMLIG